MESPSRPQIANRIGYLNPSDRIDIHKANLPHWRQNAVTYYVTFRLIDSLPQGKLDQWKRERASWLAHHPLPLTDADKAEYLRRFSRTFEHWLDQGSGSCVLALPECRMIVEGALRHFDGQRYHLEDFVIARNHVHVLVTPIEGHDLGSIAKSWKSFSAKQMIQRVAEVGNRLSAFWEESRARRAEHSGGPVEFQRSIWQKEYFDHILRDPSALERFTRYIRGHREWKRHLAA